MRVLSNRRAERDFLRKRRSKEAGESFSLQRKTEQSELCSDVVEARGIEPLSENLFISGTTSVVCGQDSPSLKSADKL